MCTINPNKGDSLAAGIANHLFSDMTIELPETVTWYNNYTITNGTSASIDGARRDRLVWPDDIAVSLPSIFVSTNDMSSVKNSLDSLLVLQRADGMFSYAGVPFGPQQNKTSFTYHLYTMIDISYYYLYTGDYAYLESTWDQFQHGMAWSLSSIDSSGLMNVTHPDDWLRVGMGGHVRIHFNNVEGLL